MDLWGSGLSSWASDTKLSTHFENSRKILKDLGSNPSRSDHEGGISSVDFPHRTVQIPAGPITKPLISNNYNI